MRAMNIKASKSTSKFSIIEETWPINIKSIEDVDSVCVVLYHIFVFYLN